MPLFNYQIIKYSLHSYKREFKQSEVHANQSYGLRIMHKIFWVGTASWKMIDLPENQK
jgi:hypothetical protein